MAEHSTHNPGIEGSNHTPVRENEKKTRRHDTQHNDIQHNDIQQTTLSQMTLSINSA